MCFITKGYLLHGIWAPWSSHHHEWDSLYIYALNQLFVYIYYYQIIKWLGPWSFLNLELGNWNHGKWVQGRPNGHGDQKYSAKCTSTNLPMVCSNWQLLLLKNPLNQSEEAWLCLYKHAQIQNGCDWQLQTTKLLWILKKMQSDKPWWFPAPVFSYQSKTMNPNLSMFVIIFKHHPF